MNRSRNSLLLPVDVAMARRSFSLESSVRFIACLVFAFTAIMSASLQAEDVGERWGTEEREREFYPIVSIPLP